MSSSVRISFTSTRVSHPGGSEWVPNILVAELGRMNRCDSSTIYTMLSLELIPRSEPVCGHTTASERHNGTKLNSTSWISSGIWAAVEAQWNSPSTVYTTDFNVWLWPDSVHVVELNVLIRKRTRKSIWFNLATIGSFCIWINANKTRATLDSQYVFHLVSVNMGPSDSLTSSVYAWQTRESRKILCLHQFPMVIRAFVSHEISQFTSLQKPHVYLDDTYCLPDGMHRVKIRQRNFPVHLVRFFFDRNSCFTNFELRTIIVHRFHCVQFHMVPVTPKLQAALLIDLILAWGRDG